MFIMKINFELKNMKNSRNIIYFKRYVCENKVLISLNNYKTRN